MTARRAAPNSPVEQIRVLHVEEEPTRMDKVQGIDTGRDLGQGQGKCFNVMGYCSFFGQHCNTPSSDEGGTDDRRGQRARDEGWEAKFVINPTEGKGDRRRDGLPG